jgi:hypothetical protein
MSPRKYDGAWRLDDGRILDVTWDGGGYTLTERRSPLNAAARAPHSVQYTLGETRDTLRTATRLSP